MTKLTQHEQSQLGRAAHGSLDVIDAAFDVVRDGLTKKMLGLGPLQSADILSLHSAINATETARQAVRQVIATGQLADAAIEAANRS